MAQIIQWNATKARLNLMKHGVSFDEAASVFSDPLSLTIHDPMHSDEEQRFIIMGLSSRNRLIVVVHTDHDKSIRIISARVAAPRERRGYEEA